MKHLIFVVALLPVYAVAVHAKVLKDTFTYSCKFKGKTYPLKLDGAQRAFVWRGKTYKTTELDAGADNNPCPRFGWHVEGNGEKFDFCTATQGIANFDQSGADVMCSQ